MRKTKILKAKQITESVLVDMEWIVQTQPVFHFLTGIKN